jgi:hypothetical protein
MKVVKINGALPVLTLLCAFGLAAQVAAAAPKAKALPTTLTTEKGKTYRSVQLVSTEADGLVIQYRPEEGGLGMTKVKFRNLPERLREEFNYNEAAAAEFESAQAQRMAEWREQLQTPEAQAPEPGEQPAPRAAEEMQPASGGDTYPAGRFRASATIRGAMIVDSITGQAWLVDLHSTLDDYYVDRSYFLQPKVMLPERERPQAIVIGP